MAQTENARELIVSMLMQINAGEEYSHVLLRSVLEKYDYLDKRDKAFIKQVTEGSLERQITIDYILNAFSRTPVRKMKPFIRELLRMSVYQIIYMSRVPDRAAINEAVKLAGKRGFGGLSGFVNGVLRTIAREGKDYPLPDQEKKPVLFLSVKYSMPEWIVEKFLKDFGREKTLKILCGLSETRPVTIRFQNTVSMEERAVLLDAMNEKEICVRKHPYLETAYELSGLEGAAALPGFREGKITVQDVSSMLAVEAAGIKPGDSVLDLCAAPGGKTAYAAMLTGTEGYVEARDISSYKTAMIEETCARLGLKNVTVKMRDARLPDEADRECADVVFADVPCMGLGVMGRKRDIKYRICREDIASITELQKQIVRTAAFCVKPRGTLLYSTCSMTREENEEMVSFMAKELGLKAESMEAVLPKGFLDCLRGGELEEIAQGTMRLLPGIHETDGFFFARMKKV